MKVKGLPQSHHAAPGRMHDFPYKPPGGDGQAVCGWTPAAFSGHCALMLDANSLTQVLGHLLVQCTGSRSPSLVWCPGILSNHHGNQDLRANVILVSDSQSVVKFISVLQYLL